MRAAAEAKVGIVVVSHSRLLAEGVVELAAQMAPQVAVLASGGDGVGGLGTDFNDVGSAMISADSGAGVVVLYDLGSAKMVAEMAVEESGDADRVVVVDAPLVEGAVWAAVAAQGGAPLADVVAAAVAAGASSVSVPPVSLPLASLPFGGRPSLRLVTPPVCAEILLTNEVGLHARPSALLARTVAELDADVVVGFDDQEADAKSVLAVMGLGARCGERIRVTARGKDAEEAVRRVEELAERGFDE